MVGKVHHPFSVNTVRRGAYLYVTLMKPEPPKLEVTITVPPGSATPPIFNLYMSFLLS
jgi:hypothetical protein